MDMFHGLMNLAFLGFTILFDSIRDGHPVFGLFFFAIYYGIVMVFVTPLINAVNACKTGDR